MSEYATLKAIGYKHTYLLSIVLQQSIILAILGYVPGFLISAFLYQVAKSATLLPIVMESTRSWLILLLTFCMCFIAGTIAVGKLQTVNPSEIF